MSETPGRPAPEPTVTDDEAATQADPPAFAADPLRHDAATVAALAQHLAAAYPPDDTAAHKAEHGRCMSVHDVPANVAQHVLDHLADHHTIARTRERHRLHRELDEAFEEVAPQYPAGSPERDAVVASFDRARVPLSEPVTRGIEPTEDPAARP